jgi:hypothetical protein
VALCARIHSNASTPHSASMRRTPLAMAPSETSTNTPISPVRFTCVPPHSSRLSGIPSGPTPGTVTIRTSAPYFSPNSAIAPSAFASAIGSTCQLTSRLASTQSTTMRSIFASWSGAVCSKWV